MSSPPKIAVIITCWNYADFIGRAIESVLSQNCSSCEVFVVDDGSTDSSWAVIQQSGVPAHRINNGGQRQACLYGLSRTTAPFVLFLDADDELLPGSLNELIGKLHSEVAKIQYPLKRIDPDGNVINAPSPDLGESGTKDIRSRILKSGVYTTPPTSGNVFRRDVCELLRDVDYEEAVDGIILLAAPFMGEIVSLKHALGAYRIHGRNESGIGKELDPQLLRRDLRRFSDRIAHLGHVLARTGNSHQLVSAEETYYYQQLLFYLAIAESQPVKWKQIGLLVVRLWGEQHTLKMKFSMTMFTLLTGILSPERAKLGLLYRLSGGHRSPLGFLRAVRLL